MSSAGAPIRFRSGYSNGSIHMNKNVKNIASINGFSASIPDLSDFGSTLLSNTLFYSAIDFEVSENAAQQTTNIPFINVGGLGNSYIDYPSRTADDSAYNWRFITDRHMTGRMQAVGNSHRDSDNDGQGDANGRGIDVSFAGMTQADAKRAATFSGQWTASNSHFDITEGQYPVLKRMPYPHTVGAVWMKEEFKADPGIAYQRATFDDYRSAP